VYTAHFAVRCTVSGSSAGECSSSGQRYAAVHSTMHSRIFAYLCALLIDIRVGPEIYGRCAKTCITPDIHQMPVDPPGLIFMPVAVEFLWEPEFGYTARGLAVVLAGTANNREFV